MRIVGVEARCAAIPLTANRSLPRADQRSSAAPEALQVLIATVRSDDGAAGCGYAVFPGSNRAVIAFVEDALSPLIVGGDPWQTERLYAQTRKRYPELGSGGSEAMAYAAVDVAMWDLKGKSVGLPVYQLLGAARSAAPTHFAETNCPEWTREQIVDQARVAVNQGISGVHVAVDGRDPIRDAQKLQRVRDELGEEVWFGVDGRQGLNLNTALAFGKFLEEDLDADLYADPVRSNDMEALARISGELGMAVAAGATLGADALPALIRHTRVAVLRVDLGRVGGITPLLPIVGAAQVAHRVVMPIGYPEVAVHLCCGLPGVAAVDYQGWLSRQFTGGPSLTEGALVPADQPGLGIAIRQ